MTTSTEIQKKLEWRYATKAFDPAKKIPAEKWETLENSLLLAPSSMGLQPWKFIVVENADLRAKLRPVSYNQSQITDASHLVVLAAHKGVDEKFIDRYVDRIMQVRGVTRESLAGYEKSMKDALLTRTDKNTWAARQAYIAMGFILETAALLEVDACPMEGFNPAAYDELLGLNSTEYGSVAVVALGYRSPQDPFQNAAKVRFPKAEVLTHIK
jgi:nitroreductase